VGRGGEVKVFQEASSISFRTTAEHMKRSNNTESALVTLYSCFQAIMNAENVRHMSHNSECGERRRGKGHPRGIKHGV
jgi:hypothetical protein